MTDFQPDPRSVLPPTSPNTSVKNSDKSDTPDARNPMIARILIALGIPLAIGAGYLLWTRSSNPTEPVPATSANAAPAAPDSVVMLDSTGMRLAGVEVLTVTASMQNELLVNGAITFDADRVSVVAPRAEGRILRMQADLGQEVTSGQTLAIVDSPEIGQIRGDLERALATVDVAKRNYEREKRLYEQNISPQKEMLDAEVLYRTSEADVRSAQAKLETYGATEGKAGTYALVSAVGGTVVERTGSPGQIIGPTTTLFTVADLRHVWITVDVYESDFKRVTTGAAVQLSATAYPDEQFEGRVRSMGGVLDTLSHTFKARVVVENPARRLRPGMFAQVRIRVPARSTAKGELVLPDVAVQEIDGKSVVFVATAKTGVFVARPVTLGARTGSGSVHITNGVSAGDRVVVKGAFQLKAQMTKSSFGDGE